MKKLVAFLVLGTGILAIARADDTPHLEFVKQLRAKQYGDLALRYLDLLEKKAPPEIVAFLPIERASIYLDQAQQSTSPAERSRLYDKARDGFETFIKNSQGKNPALAAIAQLEASRILGLQGRGRLNRTRALNGGPLTAELTNLLALFEKANVQLEKAGAALDAQLRGKQPEKMKAALEQARLQADLELALNQLDQGLVSQGLNKVAEGGKKVESAIGQFKGLLGRDPRGPLGLLARAWIVKCYAEIDQNREAKKAYDDAMADKSANGEAARRMARFFYFQILTQGRNPAALTAKKGDDLQKEIRDLARDWVKQYPSHLATFEGNTIRFELANSLRLQGKAFPMVGVKKDQLDARARPYLTEALQLYEDLDALETEYASEVKNGQYDCMSSLSDATAEIKPGDARKIQDFAIAMSASKRQGFALGKLRDQLYQLQGKKSLTKEEAATLADLEKNLPKREKEIMKGVEEILLRALELAREGKTGKAKAKDVMEARANLAWVLLTNGDPHRAVVVGEHAAHLPTGDPLETKQAAQAAAWALQAYVQLISKGNKDGYPKEMVAVDRQRFRRLVDYMETTWKDDPATDSARHQLGSQMLMDKDYKNAEEVLGRVSDRYDPAALVDARYRWCVACQELAKDAKTEAERKKYRAQSIKALRSVPELTGNPGPEIASAYVRCKLMLGGILFESKEYKALETMALALKAQISGLKLKEADKAGLQRTAETLLNYAVYGRANDEVNKGNYAEAIKMTDAAMKPVAKELDALRSQETAIRKPYLADLEKTDELTKEEKALPEELKKRLEELREKIEPVQQAISPQADLYRNLLLVALRATVLDGNRGLARGLLDKLLEESRRDKIGLQVLKVFVQQLKKQMDDLKKKDDPKSKAQLDKLIVNFTSFLDNMGKQTNLDPGLVFFLAGSYSNIGTYKDRNLHADAARLLDQIKEPKIVPGVKSDPKADNTYRAARLEYVRELRMARKFPEGRKALEEIASKPWGKGFSVMQEKPLLLMEEGKYGLAAQGWKNIIGSFGAKPDFSNAKKKENYFESYYQYIYCFYMFAKTSTEPKVKAKAGDYVKRVAGLIVKLEDTPPGDMGGEMFKTRYQDLLAKEPPLKKEYDAIKKAKAAPATK